MSHRFCLALGVFLACLSPASAQLPPDKAEKSFKVSEGLELTLWASEPLCVNPTMMDIDHKGRVWYCESVNYRQKLFGQKKLRRPEGDCIVILEDTKGAGKADKRTIFYQAPDFICPLGIAIAPYPDGKGCKVYVCHSPHIYVFEDKDGDLKADGPPKILLTGFGGHDHDHGVHGISIGPDNKLYFSVGDTGVKDLQSSDGKGRKWTSNQTDCRAGTIWRCDLDGKNLELIAHNFRNNYKPAIDSFGAIFISDNDDDGLDQTRICYVMPGGNYGYHPRGPGQTHWHEEQPGVVPKVLRTFRGSPCGMCFYEGTLLPKKYQGQLLHTDAGPGRLSCYHLKEKGAGYEVEREDMVTSSDSWFRPSDVCVAPDGSVFVCDWYDPGVGGHGVGDLTRGRIYRVAPHGNKASVPRVDLNSISGWMSALASPALAVRTMAMSPTAQRISDLSELKKVLATENKSGLEGRVIWRIVSEWKDNKTSRGQLLHVLSILASKSPVSERCLAIRALSDVELSYPQLASANKLPSSAWQTIIRDEASIRREALLWLRNWPPESAKDLLGQLARQYDGKDRFYLAAIGIAVGQPGISAEIDKRREIILADFEKHFPEWNDKVAGLVWELRPPGMMKMLEKHLRDAKPQARLQIIDILAAQSDPACGFALVKSLASEKSADIRASILGHLKNHLGGKWKELRQNAQLEEVVGKLLDNPSDRETGIALAAATENAKWLSGIIAFTDAKEAMPLRLAAVKALASFKTDEATGVLGAVASQETNSEVLRMEALGGLGAMNSSAANEILSKVAASAKRKLAERQLAVAGLAANKEGAAWLLYALGENELNADLRPDLARLLRNSPYPEVRKLAHDLLPAPPKLDPKSLPSIPALLTRRGNPARGEEIMAKTLKNDAACLKCHTINKVGGNAGPDLSTIGSKASRQNLLESILYPSRAIADQHVQWIVETKDGKVVNGIVVEEAKEHVMLRDVNVKDHKIPVQDMAIKKKSPLSLMPDNLMLYLSEDDLLDLVEYLYGLKNPPLGATSRREEIERVFVSRSQAATEPASAKRKQVPAQRAPHPLS